MPIRFRCAYCSQLMSIATRKAGTVIRCTKCAGEIIVPVLEGEAPNPGQAFESANFDAVLGTNPPAPPEPPPPSTVPPQTEPRAAGVFLSVPLLLASIGVVVLLLIAMFIAGFIIARLTEEPRDAKGLSSLSLREWGRG
jgi:DNA-directed RNA polymerase subunit RPC12/RpoP